jgi:hypothetical protein
MHALLRTLYYTNYCALVALRTSTAYKATIIYVYIYMYMYIYAHCTAYLSVCAPLNVVVLPDLRYNEGLTISALYWSEF